MFEGDFTAVISFIGTSVQLGGELLLVLLFLLLRRFVLRRGYFSAWTGAWICGAIAILAVCVRYTIMPRLGAAPVDETSLAVRALYLVYQASKLGSFALFVSGTAMYVTGVRVLGARPSVFLAAIAYAAVSLVGAGAHDALTQLVIWQAPVAVVALGACAALLFTLPPSRRTLGSVAGGGAFSLLAMLWLSYGVAFGVVSRPGYPQWVRAVVNFNPYFDLLLNITLGFAMVVLLMEDGKREVDDAQAELRVAHDQLRRAALYDALTDSLNRRAYEQGVGLEMARGTFGTVVIADLDNLKAVNDAYGHAAGDLLLRQCADLLRSTLRPYDKLYRWGGDEFLLVIPSARGVDVEARLADVLSGAMPLRVGSGAEAKLEVSLGTADYTSAESLDESIQVADHAMYRQKHSRKSPDRGVHVLRSSAPVVAEL
ncbi:MAG TPA: GGDEF domain-containing protein [Gemmatimonadaceae bacterium]|nr:GGDEF domain-containing protein [Gemmatimonadaceae bacterium]